MTELKFLVWNPRSINNKCDEVMLMLTEWNTDIAFLSETWLTDKSNATTATIKSHGFKIEHCFRDSSRGGGAAIVFKESLNVKPKNLAHTEITTFSYIACSIRCTNNVTVLMISVYRTGSVVKLFFH